MIEVTRINGEKFTINAEMIERIEEAMNTVVTLTTGNKIIVKESRQELRDLVVSYKKEIFSRNFE